MIETNLPFICVEHDTNAQDMNPNSPANTRITHPSMHLHTQAFAGSCTTHPTIHTHTHAQTQPTHPLTHSPTLTHTHTHEWTNAHEKPITTSQKSITHEEENKSNQSDSFDHNPAQQDRDQKRADEWNLPQLHETLN